VTFVIYDIIFLILFVIFVSIFLYTKRSNLKREGLLYLYRTKWGIRLINYVGGKYKKSLKFLSYVSIGTGYILMVSMFYLFYVILKIYISRPDIVSAIRVPPIMPLIPYIDKIVPGLPSFFFTYWIVILAIIAITHEFSHGIFMKRYDIKIKSTGFGFFPFFLPVFLAAFVEQDEKSMIKKGKFEQMAVLSAGTFANVLTAILFFVILLIFFSFAFMPSGVIFDGYQVGAIDASSILSVNFILVNNPTYEEINNLLNKEGLTEIRTDKKNYLLGKDLLEASSNQALFEQKQQIILYEDTPAVNAGLAGAIMQINGIKVTSLEKLEQELMKYSPGEKINIKTTEGDFEIVLGKNPQEENSPILGIGFVNREGGGVISRLANLFSPKKPHVYYEPMFGEGSEFFYNLIWWIILISVSVAILNMLPVGIFDGGRFFYLTILSITGNKKIAENSFKYITYFFLFLLLVLMVFWVISFL